MAIFRSFSEIVNSILERLRLTQPNMDTKPGTVPRDLFIDIPADQLERLHSSLLLVSEKQSPEIATGRDLDRWASNFGITRNPGAPANGIVVFTVNELNSDIPIPAGSVVVSRGGLQFKTIGSYLFSVAERNRFAANANRLRTALDLAGISDGFALEVPVKASNVGTSGNLSNFQITEHTLEDALKITNLTAFNGGTNIESDAAFRSRVFAVFSGSNTGTAFGYRNAALSVEGVNDAIVIEPGNTLMLRDGTETIQINDGSFRILSSGTGGKVDLYILGTQLEEVVESYIYTDKSGSGNAADERNDFILGQSGLDPTLTSTERRVKAFNDGVLPQQPVSALVSVIGSSSGILSEQVTNPDGTVQGNYTLIKDLNVETGGSPFGFDKLRYTSNEKEVEAESIIKQSLNSVDALRFSGTTDLVDVFQDISVVGENSTVSSADKTIIQLNHSPITTVSRVVNRTTGEVYVVESQNIDPDTGLNETGEIIISGKSLPSIADILSVDYVWRLYFDKFIDYNGEYTGAQFVDSSVSDSIDWGVSNGITAETTLIERTDDDLEYQIEVAHEVSRVISVYSAVSTSGTLSNVEGIDESLVPGVVLSTDDPAIDNVISVKNSDGVEIFNTLKNDGGFSGRNIILPTDATTSSGTTVSVFYNKVELYDILNGDGAFSNNIITLPSEDTLSSNGILEEVSDLFLTGENIYVDYVAEIEEILPSQALTNLPVNGSTTFNSLLDGTLTTISNSNQPIFYKFDSDGEITSIERFGPTRLSATISGSTRSGKIKFVGETLTRLELEVTAGISLEGLVFDLSADLKSALSLTTLPSTLGIARVDQIEIIDQEDVVIDLIGQKLNSNQYGFGVAAQDTSLSPTEFVLPATDNNNSLDLSSGEKIRINLLIYNTNDSEDLFFPGNAKMITDKIFARITRISVSSGFRSPSGSLIGSILITPTSQPGVGLSYFANYKFTAPVEGERITIRYNLNRLISDVTANLENVRSITADVLVKESPLIAVDVQGQVVINEDMTSESQTILENVSNAVVNLLNSATLGSIVDYSDVINVATSVVGIDSINISLFNESGKTGRKSFIKALDNQAIIAGEILFTPVSRKDFRIT